MRGAPRGAAYFLDCVEPLRRRMVFELGEDGLVFRDHNRFEWKMRPLFFFCLYLTLNSAQTLNNINLLMNARVILVQFDISG